MLLGRRRAGRRGGFLCDFWESLSERGGLIGIYQFPRIFHLHSPLTLATSALRTSWRRPSSIEIHRPSTFYHHTITLFNLQHLPSEALDRSIAMNHYRCLSRISFIVFLATVPTMFALNARCCRRCIVRSSASSISRLTTCSSPVHIVPSFGLTALAEKRGFDSSFRLASSTTLLSLSAKDTQETSKSSMVRSIRPDKSKTGQSLQLLSFYRFIPISDPESIRDVLFDKLKNIHGLRGTVYVAQEGINAQFSVPEKSLQELLAAFGKEGDVDEAVLPFDVFEKEPPNMGDVVDESVPTFDRLIVRTRDYILRDGISTDDDENTTLNWQDAGIELDAEDWDAQLRPHISIDKDDTIQLLDCRNTYESNQGTFLQSKPLNTQTFSETWPLLEQQLQSNMLDPSKPTYIFCTGGIRCVKVGAYLKQRLGFENVRSLKHGIIGYQRWRNDKKQLIDGDTKSDLNESSGSLWNGENFLFDKRRFADEIDENSQ